MTDETRNEDLEVDKQTLKDLEAKDSEDVKGGASGMNDCKPLTDDVIAKATTRFDSKD